MSGTLDFEGRPIPFVETDTVASALFRAGVRTFTRSLKLHRRRGLLCLSGDCPNCLVSVDGVPGIRSCTAPCRDGMRVRRESGWPSAEHDLLHVTDRLHRLMPVGFYSKTFIRPRWAWTVAERVIRLATGVGRLPLGRPVERRVSRTVHTDVLVVGAGAAGLAAARDAAGAGERVLLCDEAAIGAAIAPGPDRDRVRQLEAEVRALPEVTVLEGHAALGLYEGPLVPLASEEELVHVRPRRVVVATGATEVPGVFPGSDLPGAWLGRGAARMAGVHGVRPGEVAVVEARTEEGLRHAETLGAAGVRIAALVVPEGHGGRSREAVEGEVVAAEGRRAVEAAVLHLADGRRFRVRCDALVLSLGLLPRDGLLRMAGDEPVEAVGDAAGEGDPLPALGRGTVCLCEDVSTDDLEQAWREGFRSAEILKRYTTATMGPCRGAMCGRYLTAFATARAPGDALASARPTARPPLRPVALGTLAAAVHEVIDKRTSLHDLHVAAGARMDRSGGWLRPFHYGDARAEYRAVRERVSLMDVGTLGKFLVAGRHAATLLDRVFPCRVEDLAPGRARYLLALDEAGYVMDDGMLLALGDGAFGITSTSGGAPRMEAWLRGWIDRLELHVHLVDRTAELGAVNVAGPLARELLGGLTEDDLSAEAIPYPGHAEITVAGVPCRAIRTGFVGELAFELHHPRSRGPALWEALAREGRAFDLLPHGLDALELLRLEKGHVYLGQDTLPDDTPAKLGLGWAVAMDKPWFVGKMALERMSALPIERKLVGLQLAGLYPDAFALRGAPLVADGRVVGRLTSAARSAALGKDIGLGWVRAIDGAFPDELHAGPATARVVPTPFYDPEGVRLRG